MTPPAPRSRAKSRARAASWLAVTGLALTLTAGGPAGAGTGGDPELRTALDAVLADERLIGGNASVVVRDAESGETLYDRDGDNRLAPASNTKLLTSAAAMELLGADHRFRTDVLADGDRRGGVLKGDLYLRGTGDPTMLAEDYDALAAEVAASGVKKVTGRLVADDTRFDDARLGRGWAADDESAYYSSQISPLTLAPDTDYDAGTVYLSAAPGAKAGDAPKVSQSPATDYVTIDVSGAETVAAGEEDTLSISREHGTNTIEVTGQIPLDADPTTSWTAVWEPTGYAADVFADALERHGVKVAGKTRLGRAAPKDAQQLAAHDSMPLKDLLVPFMKLSNNNHAEVLTKAIGHEVGGEGSWDAGLTAIADYLKKEGVGTDTLRQADGSGLSRMNLVPAEQLAQLLVSVRDASWYRDWYASLPVACAADREEGGTLRSRMCDTPAEGNVRAKTGSLTGVSGLSGYVTDAEGRELVFSVVTNNYLASSVKDIEDRIAVTLASRGGDAAKGSVPPGAERSGPAATGGGGDASLECSWTKPRGC